MKSTLEYRNGHLCVLNRSKLRPNDPQCPPDTLREWYPVREATEGEVAILAGRSVNSVEPDEGLYADEEGNPYQLSEQGRTPPLAVEMTLAANETDQTNNKREGGTDGQARADAMSAGAISTGGIAGEVRAKTLMRKPRRKGRTTAAGRGAHDQLSGEACSESSNNHLVGEESAGDERPAGNISDRDTSALNLRQKLAEVRRRLGYIQKRGHNERHHYNYVMAADLAGAVGDVLSELGVVVIPQLQSISTETPRSSNERIARIVMNYRFVDARSGEELTVRVAGEGADVGDKAPYKAMTGALKYALLQSFLIASGDDPEDERGGMRNVPVPERPITPEQIRELEALIEETGTELERVLAYYKVSALEEMTESAYRRALELLNRKLAKHGQGKGVHA
jgi:hypothetical protein